MRERVAAWHSSHTHTRIGQIACMTTVCAGRVYFDLRLQALTLNDSLHHGVRRWRAAYITQADKEYFLFHNSFLFRQR